MLIRPSTASSRLSFSSPCRHSSNFQTFALDRSGRAAQIELHDPGADVGPADIDGEDRVMRLEHPRRSQMHGANEARFIGIVANNADFGFDVVEL